MRVRRVGVADMLGDDDALCSDAGSGQESGDDADEDIVIFCSGITQAGCSGSSVIG